MRRILLLEFDEPGSLNLAGSAPGGPEVELNRLALVAGQRNLFAAEIGQREGRGFFAYERRREVRRAIRAGGDEGGLGFLCSMERSHLLAVLVVGPAGEAEQCEDEDDDYGYENVAFHGMGHPRDIVRMTRLMAIR